MKSTWPPGETTIVLGLAPLEVIVTVASGDGVGDNVSPGELPEQAAPPSATTATRASTIRQSIRGIRFLPESSPLERALLRTRVRRMPASAWETASRHLRDPQAVLFSNP